MHREQGGRNGRLRGVRGVLVLFLFVCVGVRVQAETTQPWRFDATQRPQSVVAPTVATGTNATGWLNAGTITYLVDEIRKYGMLLFFR